MTFKYFFVLYVFWIQRASETIIIENYENQPFIYIYFDFFCEVAIIIFQKLSTVPPLTLLFTLKLTRSLGRTEKWSLNCGYHLGSITVK